ncbi:MAG: dihydrodipicolinate synthase family protein [Armatimonadetes bacterium]|nr:dihydrodipicolinate synthase family protein [Armatimonadota bacterium]MDW8122599.1 dihydrodipicolinate synthase family protein [Armatimonadota bacterium]
MIEGIIPPLVTPFNDRDEIDETALRTQVRLMVRAGVHGLAVCGSTGEGHTLSDDEARQVATIVVEEAGNLPVIFGIIVNSTKQAVRRALSVRDLPIRALMVTPPHYLFTPSEQEMFDYFRVIGEESGRPVLVYNVIPWSYLTADALIRLMGEEERVIGVKQSAGDLHSLAVLVNEAPKGKVILTAVDDLLYPSFVLGVQGAIGGICTAQPFWCVGLWEAVRSGDHKSALEYHRKLLRLWKVLEGPNFPARVKAALTILGAWGGRPRRPLSPVNREDQERIRTVLAEG